MLEKFIIFLKIIILILILYKLYVTIAIWYVMNKYKTNTLFAANFLYKFNKVPDITKTNSKIRNNLFVVIIGILFLIIF